MTRNLRRLLRGFESASAINTPARWAEAEVIHPFQPFPPSGVAEHLFDLVVDPHYFPLFNRPLQIPPLCRAVAARSGCEESDESRMWQGRESSASPGLGREFRRMSRLHAIPGKMPKAGRTFCCMALCECDTLMG